MLSTQSSNSTSTSTDELDRTLLFHMQEYRENYVAIRSLMKADPVAFANARARNPLVRGFYECYWKDIQARPGVSAVGIRTDVPTNIKASLHLICFQEHAVMEPTL